MSMQPFDRGAPRRAVNLTLNGDLVAKARQEKLNLSAVAEAAISEALTRIHAERLRAEVARSVAEHAKYLEVYGSLGEAVRRRE